jgi:hypothetical protein
VLLQQPDGQLTGESANLLLTLVEGDELILLVRVEHEIKDRLGLLEPLLAQTLARRGWERGHGRTPGIEETASRIV